MKDILCFFLLVLMRIVKAVSWIAIKIPLTCRSSFLTLQNLKYLICHQHKLEQMPVKSKYVGLVLLVLFTLASACSNCQNCNGSLCTICSSGYYVNNNICSPCSQGCRSCQGQTKCSTCFDNYTLVKQSNSCVLIIDCDVQCDECKDKLCNECSCKSYEKAKSTTDTLSIAIYVLLALIFLTIAAFLLHHCCQKADTQSEQNRYNPQIASLFAALESEKHIKDHIVKWQKLIEIFNSEELCSVCLSSQTNVITQCGHSYHEQCINKWLMEHKQCPICRKNQYSPLKHVCIGCYQNYFESNTKAGYIRSQSQQTCPECNIK